MKREYYLSIEGPKGTAEIFELAGETKTSPAGQDTFDPTYEVNYQGKVSVYSSEGEAITVAQQMVGARSSY